MEIRYAVLADASVCNAFYNGYYGTSRTDEQWSWEFAAPTGNGTLPYVLMIEAGEIVGTQAFIPIRFIDVGGPFMTAKSEETLVAASMRGRNVLGQLYERLFQYARDHDFKSIWGFTPAEHAFKKLDFQIPGRTKQLFLAIEPNALIEAAQTQGGTVSGLRAMAIRGVGAGLSIWSRLTALRGASRLRPNERMVDLEDADLFADDYSRRFVDTWGGTTILRDRAFMTWRLFKNPYRRANVVAIVSDGRLAGHVAFAIGDDGTGYLVDVMAAHPLGKKDDARIIDTLVAEAIRRLRRMGATCIRGWTLNGHPFDEVVRRAAARRGFLVLNRGHAVVFHTGFQSEPRGGSHDDFANWYVTRLFTEGVTG